MKRTYIKSLKAGKCLVKGYVETIRDQKTMQFVVLRDITGAVQITVFKKEQPELAETVSKLTPHSFIDVEGECKIAPQVKVGGKEILPTIITIQSIAEMLPIDESSGIDSRLEYRWVDIRKPKNILIFEISSYLEELFREFLRKEGFIEIHAPRLMGTESESGAGVFEVKYFDTKAYLIQSPQFYKQMAIASGLDKVFDRGPIFRAEKSFTPRHSTEFTGLDVEIGHIESYNDILSYQQRILTYALKGVKERFGEEIKQVFDVDITIPPEIIPQMTLDELYLEFEKHGLHVQEDEKGDLSTEMERLAGKIAMEKFGSEFIAVTGYSAKKRAFYHMRDEKGTPLGYDLIWKGIEIATSAQREHRYAILEKQAEEKGLKKDVEKYLDFFKYGCPPHGGWGFGFDRILMLLLGLPSLKEVQFVFRGPNRLLP